MAFLSSIILLAGQLAVALIFQDEAPYLKEWIEYYRMMGVDHFYLYNNRSRDNYLEVVGPYQKSGLIELRDWPQKSGKMLWSEIQISAYADALDRARKDQIQWLAIIDADEFLVPRTKETLTALLSEYENETIGSLQVRWVCFGTSFVPKIPTGRLMIETLLLNEGYGYSSGKSIVRPMRVDPSYRGGAHAQTLYKQYNSVVLPFKVMQCNHYWTRDEHYFNTIKIPRKTSGGFSLEMIANLNDKFNQSTPASEPILRFVPLLRERLFSDASQKALR